MKLLISRLLLAALAAASISINSFGQSLPRGTWHIVEYRFGEKVEMPADKAEVTLNIRSGGKLGGNSGCNVYGGSYRFKDGKLVISDLISTMMYCSDDLASFERQFGSTLTGADVFKVEKDTLTFTDTDNGSYIKFERSKPRSGSGTKAKSGN